ncbi:molybdopterin converting factor subunit 1 [Neobacillus notoginsengisoli]|uniref:Molybdopterin synthase sulfur carrier subunit n=1 Tax=Neobacillus notoginsengisoli TaxID=1578198 RepID=A0A417YTA2_9BACI|nr:molybdopterin converting factor subunit 1 [Neobacillus notoginsengisoli]RHW40253.1 molybdopterin converting factor subunit 1 [Neobacillus notoginsengisoli]
MNKVMFFAHLRDAAGVDSITVDAAGKTVGELKAELAEKYNLPKMDSVMAAINEEFSSNDETIREGDVIAFIPPVSGG